MTRFDIKPSPLHYFGIELCLLVVFLIDYYTPLGYAEWVLYCLPVVFSLGSSRPLIPLIVAVAATVLTVVGYEVSPAGVEPQVAMINRAFGMMTVWMIGGIGWFFIKSRLAVRKQEWLQTGLGLLNEKLAGEQTVAELSGHALHLIAGYLDAKAGAIFVEENGMFRRMATFAVPATEKVMERFTAGEGLLGQAALDKKARIVSNVPAGYLSIGSALGQQTACHLLLSTAQVDGEVNAVVELGFFQPVPESDLELLARAAEPLGVAVRSAKYRARLHELLEETQRQSEELQAQSEELRVSNEELEEQSRALEAQQVELEQTNSQLEEQTQLLEAQKEELQRASYSLERQARVVEQASRYKSNFLANMSHELRTPLNSSLILAQLLAENRSGNLNEEQIKYARTIQASGNDLLALINDVLDLSKIEAGRMELKPQRQSVARLLDHLRQVFEPLANEKRLTLRMEAADDLPESLETDPQRLEQVLKNLLSNAIKFTEKGEVTLNVRTAPGSRLSFSVRDTGIGISKEQQASVFEPFFQGDGTPNRKYGGTGLGLSISRELARLLGGDIQLQSEPGQGSVFTLVVPEACATPGSARAAGPQPSSGRSEISSEPTSARKVGEVRRHGAVVDDREALSASGRAILIIEDDEPFARILAELAQEQRFQRLVATTADEGLALAQQHQPSAIVLDIGLPDSSGLLVLERLKHDPHTRHIPVHVVSAADHSEKAYSMGAVGYLLKPVAREQLAKAFEKLETRFTQKLRRVLIVEDDAVQLDALRKLLGSREVDTVGVCSAAECLEKLKENTFDCMVLDLSLPDASGFSLLETLSEDDVYSFPPVIVYTGRELDSGEEERLRRYSKSIIVKGAKSPERLLDEVTLFLHQVVSELPPEQQRMLEQVRNRDAVLEGRRILMAEDDVRNIFALTSLLEPLGVKLTIARNGREAIEALERSAKDSAAKIDLVLMDIMMPEMDGLTAMREIRGNPAWKGLPMIALTAKAMRSDQERCLEAGASDYLSKPLDVDKLLSLIRVWMPR